LHLSESEQGNNFLLLKELSWKYKNRQRAFKCVFHLHMS